MKLSDSATADTRYTFTGQFLEASAMFVRRTRLIEATATPQTDDATRCEHRGLVCDRHAGAGDGGLPVAVVEGVASLRLVSTTNDRRRGTAKRIR